MRRYTIWRRGTIVGTYSGVSEAAALDAACKDEGYDSFDSYNEARNLTRNDYRTEEVK